MLIFSIILLMVGILGILVSGKFKDKSPESRLLLLICVVGVGGFIIYKLDNLRDENIRDNIANFVNDKRGEILKHRRVTSDGEDRLSGSRITDINTYFKVELKDGRVFIVGFNPELFGDYFGSLYQVKEWYRNRG